MGTDVLVVIACHFRTRDELCKTSIARLGAALRWGYNHGTADTFFFVTGNVPYERGSKTLAALMREYLRLHGVPTGRIIIGAGIGTFDEAQTVTRQIAENSPRITAFTVMSSHWYLWPGRLVWERAARERGLSVSFAPVYGTGDWRIRLFYLGIATLLRLFTSIGLFEWSRGFAQRRIYAKRAEGFTWNGCGEKSPEH